MSKGKAGAAALVMLAVIVGLNILVGVPILPYIIAGILGGWLLDNKFHAIPVLAGFVFFLLLGTVFTFTSALVGVLGAIMTVMNILVLITTTVATMLITHSKDESGTHTTVSGL